MYVAVSVSLPPANAPAGTTIVALPLVNVDAVEVYVPLASVTVPVAVGLPVPPLTITVTESDWAVVMLKDAGVTVTVGFTTVTVTAPDPDALLYVPDDVESGVYDTFSVSLPAASLPAGILIVAAPLASAAAADV